MAAAPGTYPAPPPRAPAPALAPPARRAPRCPPRGGRRLESDAWGVRAREPRRLTARCAARGALHQRARSSDFLRMSRRALAQMRVAVGLEGAPPPPPARAAPPLCCPHPREDAHRVCRRSVGARETPHTHPAPNLCLGRPAPLTPTGRPRSKGPIERRKGVQRLFDRLQTRSDRVSPPLSAVATKHTGETLSRRPA